MKFTIITLLLLTSFGCDNAGKPLPQNTNTAAATSNKEKPQTAIAHSLENQPQKNDAPTGEKSKWTQSGDPIDTKEFNSAIASAEVALGKKPSDAEAKKAVAAAYFNRAEALTKARQYASALGDYRKALKYDPSNTDAKEWIDKIIMIYESINRGYPKEGEEPPPLPFEKGKK
ncbi:MAG: tetratricopeptide repeat protein [Chloracidobacterium sp.]|nr:tetratricopeptide repeat protein [Chloracidobacterium sp.]